MDKEIAPSVHLGYLDGLRAAAALYVVLHHISIQTAINFEALPSFGRIALRLLGYGHYAVDLFIVLSGFCLMLPVAKGNGCIRGGAIAFIKRRAIRIIPPYYCAIILSLVLIWLFIGNKVGTIWDLSLPVTSKSVLAHLFLIQDLVGEAHTIDYPAWSVSVEWRIYFLFPLLVWSWKRYGPIRTSFGAIMVSYLLVFMLNAVYHNDFSMHYIGLFAMGMFAAEISFSERWRVANKLAWDVLTVLALPIILFASTPRLSRGEEIPLYLRDYIVGIGSMSMLISISRASSHPIKEFFSCKPLAFTGLFAYSIYLIHAPILQIIWLFFPSLQQQQWEMLALQVCVGIPLTVGTSYIFFLLFEQPFLRLKTNPRVPSINKSALEPDP